MRLCLLPHLRCTRGVGGHDQPVHDGDAIAELVTAGREHSVVVLGVEPQRCAAAVAQAPLPFVLLGRRGAACPQQSALRQCHGIASERLCNRVAYDAPVGTPPSSAWQCCPPTPRSPPPPCRSARHPSARSTPSEHPPARHPSGPCAAIVWRLRSSRICRPRPSYTRRTESTSGRRCRRMTRWRRPECRAECWLRRACLRAPAPTTRSGSRCSPAQQRNDVSVSL